VIVGHQTKGIAGTKIELMRHPRWFSGSDLVQRDLAAAERILFSGDLVECGATMCAGTVAGADLNAISRETARSRGRNAATSASTSTACRLRHRARMMKSRSFGILDRPCRPLGKAALWYRPASHSYKTSCRGRGKSARCRVGCAAVVRSWGRGLSVLQFGLWLYC
jgi:hypothetical protein